jgi:DNA polymerase I
VHDALLITAPVKELETAVAKTRTAMARASRIVLDGFELRVGKPELVHSPDRYMDKRGAETWGRIMGLLDEIEAAETRTAAE